MPDPYPHAHAIFTFVRGEPPSYGHVSRDNARLAVRLFEEPVVAGDVSERRELLSASITLASAEDIKQLYLNYQAAGVAAIIRRGLKRKICNTRGKCWRPAVDLGPITEQSAPLTDK